MTAFDSATETKVASSNDVSATGQVVDTFSNGNQSGGTTGGNGVTGPTIADTIARMWGAQGTT
jgi:hypothetical protein